MYNTSSESESVSVKERTLVASWSTTTAGVLKQDIQNI